MFSLCIAGMHDTFTQPDIPTHKTYFRGYSSGQVNTVGWAYNYDK